MGEAKRRKELGLYPEYTKKPPRKSKRQIEREIRSEILPLFYGYLGGTRRMEK